MRPWRNRKAILALILLVAVAAGATFIVGPRLGGEDAKNVNLAQVGPAKGGPAKPAAASSATPIQAARGAAKAVEARPVAASMAGSTAPSSAAPGATPAAAGNAAASAVSGQSGATGAAFAEEPEGDPTDRLAHWQREPYYYASLGRRDPFGSLVSGNFESDGEVGLVDVGDMKLVGIAWDDIDRFAMVEDSRGFGHALREGDPVRSGRVLRIERDSVTFLQTSAGESTTITIDLPIRGGD